MDNKIIIAVVLLILVVVAGIFISRMDTDVEPVDVSIEEASALAEEWVESYSPTYNFDGSALEVVSVEETDGSMKVFLAFDSSSAGYGDRSDEMSAQVITPHEVVVTVEEGEVVSVVTDEVFDEMEGEMIEEENMTSVNVYFVVVEDGVEDIVSVEREVSAENVEVETVALLLEGPTTTEQAEGYSTAIDEETELIALDIQEGVAYVDFTSELDVDGGSAWVTMIRDQITETLLQFDSIDEVVIFIEGEEEVLQP